MLKKRMSFSKVRNAHKTENTEDYLELIAELLNSKGEARIVDIADSLGIAQATANKTIQRLQSQGFIKREPYRSIFLTLKGQKIASKSLEYCARSCSRYRERCCATKNCYDKERCYASCSAQYSRTPI